MIPVTAFPFNCVRDIVHRSLECGCDYIGEFSTKLDALGMKGAGLCTDEIHRIAELNPRELFRFE